MTARVSLPGLSRVQKQERAEGAGGKVRAAGHPRKVAGRVVRGPCFRPPPMRYPQDRLASLGHTRRSPTLPYGWEQPLLQRTHHNLWFCLSFQTPHVMKLSRNRNQSNSSTCCETPGAFGITSMGGAVQSAVCFSCEGRGIVVVLCMRMRSVARCRVCSELFTRLSPRGPPDPKCGRSNVYDQDASSHR